MSESNQNDLWQVEANGEVYDASFAELAEWIAEGALQPDDKVRRNNLRWIEARKVPSLTTFFNAKANGQQVPVLVTVTDADQVQNDRHASSLVIETPNCSSGDLSVIPSSGTNIKPSTAGLSDAICCSHSEREASLVCQSCGRSLCRDCVSTFGSSVAVCSLCGGMCKSRKELETSRRSEQLRENSLGGGFGLSDFGKAIAYPFKFKASLIFGAAMFMLFSLGKGAASFGDPYMIVGSIFSYMLANMLAFGILSNVIGTFAHGTVGGNFMPAFEDFSLWDDVIHPFFLSIAVWLSSFGPLVLVFLIGSYLVINSNQAQSDAFSTDIQASVGSPYAGVRSTLDQSNTVKGALADSAKINQKHLDQLEDLENGRTPAAANDGEEKDFQTVNKMIADSKRQELESVVGKSAETREKESSDFIGGFFKLAFPILVLGFITLIWGLFFFPAACTVAGYTRSFTATLNPLVGLDTIKRLGVDYVKVLFMGLVLMAAFGVVSTVVGRLFVDFDLPGMGNLPARAMESLVWFYLVIVFACVLGLAMFKASDRLRLPN